MADGPLNVDRVRCSDCRFSHDVVIEFECRRHPPVVNLDARRGDLARFPLVEDNWWCGEFEGR